MIKPSYLKNGDCVAIISTARKSTIEECLPAVKLLESWGLKVQLGKTIGLKHFQFGGTDKQRTEEMQSFIEDKTIKAIWIVRGGYGSVRIIDLLNFSPLKKHPKWIIGFSDITVFHSHLNILGFQSIHALMPINVSSATDEAIESLRKALFGENFSYTIENDSKHNKSGKAQGQLVGGNLSILYSLLGSNSSINTNGKILFIEDLDEYLYHIDRMFYNLKRNGYFKNLKGLIIGAMTQMHDNTNPFGYSVEEIVLNCCSEYDFPICFNFPSGHISNNNALLLGNEIELEVNNSNTWLRFL